MDRLRIWILLFSSVTFKTQHNNFFSKFLCLFLFNFKGTFLHPSSKTKSHKEVTKIKVFLNFLIGNGRIHTYYTNTDLSKHNLGAKILDSVPHWYLCGFHIKMYSIPRMIPSSVRFSFKLHLIIVLNCSCLSETFSTGMFNFCQYF
jgi:hypothetical protein